MTPPRHHHGVTVESQYSPRWPHGAVTKHHDGQKKASDKQEIRVWLKKTTKLGLTPLSTAEFRDPTEKSPRPYGVGNFQDALNKRCWHINHLASKGEGGNQNFTVLLYMTYWVIIESPCKVSLWYFSVIELIEFGVPGRLIRGTNYEGRGQCFVE